ncbi:CHAD domain-containing protein [Nocardioides sp. STR2]|uniref:CHAD domain-containing protein n=1 Tax=Nocardioides pini TaxID=2975053 RepID=A0ABT4CCI2_9ACTN|nr:CHAD domain-containing protein [Nocardioides pini]MCY4726666.1 CHAD domain-containing protein [Nocardioides pini]
MTVDRHLPAAEVLRSHLAGNFATLGEQEALVRSGDASAIHKMRIAARRLRTPLQTGQPLLVVPTDALVDELRWLGRELGGARDAQVLRERLRHLLSTQPPELVMGSVDVLVDDELCAAEQRGRAQAIEALGGTRYARLVDGLDRLVRDLPATEEADGPADEVLPRLVRRELKRLRRAVGIAEQADAGEANDVALHVARKKAKRLRYAAEMVVPALGRPAEELAASAKGVQQALGEHQDTVMSRRFLRELGARAHLDGMNGFTLGRLHAIEEARAAAAVADFERAWGELKDKTVRTRRGG